MYLQAVIQRRDHAETVGNHHGGRYVRGEGRRHVANGARSARVCQDLAILADNANADLIGRALDAEHEHDEEDKIVRTALSASHALPFLSAATSNPGLFILLLVIEGPASANLRYNSRALALLSIKLLLAPGQFTPSLQTKPKVRVKLLPRVIASCLDDPSLAPHPRSEHGSPACR
jgi:hypothetical protein